jgi:exonuclease SbcC
MKLLSIDLHLFRQHVSSSIHFPDGLTGIIGSNGSGKTTVVEAISFALFGSRALRGRTEDVRTRNATVAKAAEAGSRRKQDREPRIILSLDHEGVVYRIERTLSEAWLYVGGEPNAVAVGNREVTNRISTIVGMSYDEFIATYCTEQKGLEFLSGKKGATEREKFIVRMMGYDRLEEMQELVREDRKEKRAILIGYEASLGSRDELEQLLVTEQQELAVMIEKHSESTRALQKNEQEFGVVRDRMTKLTELRGRFVKQRENVQALQVRCDERTRRLRVIVDSVGLAQAEVTATVRSFGLQEDLDQERRSLINEIEGLTSGIAELQESLRQREIAWREQISRVKADLDSTVVARDHLKKRAQQLTSLKSAGECPTCGQSLAGSFDQVRDHFKEELLAFDARLAERKTALEEASVMPEDLQAIGRKKVEEDRAIESARIRLTRVDKIVLLQTRVVELQKEQSATESELRASSENLDRARLILEELQFSEDEFNREKGGHDASQRLLEVARLQRVRLEGDLKTKEAMVHRTKGEISRFDERRAEVEKLRREVRILDESDRVLTEFRKYVNTSIRPRLAELASEYLADLTDGRYTAVELAEDFTPTVLEDGEIKPIISGGEEDILNLCMRVSLSHMLAERAGQHFSLLILDEIFGSLDEGRRGNVLSLLEKLRKRFEQILIITHLDDVKEGVQHLIEVSYDEATGTAGIVESGEEVGVLGGVYNF